MAASIVWSGLAEFEAKLMALVVETPVAVAAAAYQEGHEVLTAALPRTPIDTGNLRASGHVAMPVFVGPTDVYVDVGFGGAAASYAIYVHERMDVYHASPTGAKFLEGPALEHAPQYAAHMAARLMQLVATL